LIVNTNKCGSCPNGQYDYGNNTCALCHSNCYKCSDYTTCTDCPFNFLGFQTFLFNDSKCYNPCPSGFYGVISSRLCVACDISCFNCTGTAKNCILCNTTGNYFRKIGSN